MAKPDDRRDNAKKIKYNIDRTIHNMEAAEETIEATSNEATKQQLIDKNARRKQALNAMRQEIRDEAEHQEAKD
jgi:small acid-soluble spore protein (thioredoxin-like protein)